MKTNIQDAISYIAQKHADKLAGEMLGEKIKELKKKEIELKKKETRLQNKLENEKMWFEDKKKGLADDAKYLLKLNTSVGKKSRAYNKTIKSAKKVLELQNTLEDSLALATRMQEEADDQKRKYMALTPDVRYEVTRIGFEEGWGTGGPIPDMKPVSFKSHTVITRI